MSQSLCFSRSLLVVSVAAGLSPAIGSAAVYYKQANQSSTTWKQLSEWFDQPTGGGNPATTLIDNTFDNQGYTLRTGNTSADSFGDATTTLILSSGSGKGLVIRGTSVQTVPNLIARSGQTRPGAGGARLSITNLSIPVGESLTIRPEDDASSRIFNVSITNLVGDGDILFNGGNPGGTVNFSVGNTSGFTGDLLFAGAGPVTLNFDTDFSSDGSFIVADNARIVLDQALFFSRVNIAGSDLAPGTYTFDALNSVYDTLFEDGGTGTITVVPEPTVGALLAGIGGLMMFRRRSRR